MATPAFPWLIAAIGGGALLLASLKKKKAEPSPEVPKPDEPVPEGPEPKPEIVRLYVERDRDALGRPRARFVSDNARFEPGQDKTTAFVVGRVPVRVSIAVPPDFDPPARAEAGSGTVLLEGKAGKSRTLVFEIKRHAPMQEDGMYLRDDVSVFLTANYISDDYGLSIPMRVFAVAV